MKHQEPSNRKIWTLALLLVAAPAQAATAIIDCPGRADFQACYLTTEDMDERNLATLSRGLQVDVIGRSSNGRWQVRLLDLRSPRVTTHGSWPAGGEPVGWVNPDFLVFPGKAGASAPAPAPRDRHAAGAGLFGSGAGTPGEAPLAGDAGDGTLSTRDRAATVPAPSGSGTLTGSRFIQQVAGLSGPAREAAILEALEQGQVPGFLLRFVAVPLRWQGHEATVWVAPDYLAIGTDEDFVRMPMAAPTAQRAADLFGCTLPRPRLVDAIWQHAEYRLAPRPLPPGPGMTTPEYFRRSNERIQEQLAGRPLGPLTAGHKKDIVLTNRLRTRPDRVAIYGWHRTSDNPIQPLSTVHGAGYADYSHGIRLVANQMTVDGRETTVDAVRADPELCGLLSAEQPVQVTRYP